MVTAYHGTGAYEEIKKFNPSLEVEDVESAIYNQDITDVADIFIRMIPSKRRVMVGEPFRFEIKLYTKLDISGLTSAIQQNPSLAARAAKDLEFAKYASQIASLLR